MPPVQATVGGAPYLGVQEVREAECIHHDQRLGESRAWKVQWRPRVGASEGRALL